MPLQRKASARQLKWSRIIRTRTAFSESCGSALQVMRLVAIPTEPLLAVSRRLIQPIGGVDVTPVIWVGLISLLRELLVGQQGLLSLIALRAQGLVAAAG